MKRIFLRIPSRHIRKRDLIIMVLLIFMICFVRLEIIKGDDSNLHPIVKESLKLFRNSDQQLNLLQKVENVSNMKLSVALNLSSSSNTGNDSSTTLLLATETTTTTPVPLTTTRQSLLQQILSVKNYPKLCGSNANNAQIIIKPDEELFKQNSKVTCSTASFVLFAVLSHVKNFEAREKIRQSWGSIRQLQSKRLTVLFFLYSEKPITIKEKRALTKEGVDYLDTVLINEKQSIKTDLTIYLKLFQFVIFHCKRAEYFVLVNDAMFVNIPTLLEAILTHKDTNKPATQNGLLFLCKVKKNALAMRNRKSTWFVTKQEWEGKHYPPYCDFPYGMILSQDVVRDLLICSFYAKPLWIADVFLTGVLPQKLDVSVDDFLEDFSTNPMKNHFIHGDMSHNVFLTDGRGYNDNTWRLIFNRSLREL